MKLTFLTLNNVGQYRGEVQFDLKPNSTADLPKPIVLFGGKNGAGKTTILQAILLCLYGRLSVGVRASRSEYESFLQSMIHDSKGKGERTHTAEIKLEFEYSHAGEKAFYEVQRGWTQNINKIQESLHILKNGASLAELKAEQWQDFINSIIPQPLSTLFFFDGEKIKHLAESKGSDGLAVAIHSLLGLDLVTQLQADLSYLSVETSKKSMSQGTASDLQVLENEIHTLKIEIETWKNKIANDKAHQEELVQKIQQEEVNLGNQGGSFAKMREANQIKYQRLQLEAQFKEEQLRELTEDAFPFCLVPDLLEDIEQQVKSEHEFQKQQTLVHFFQKSLKPQLETILNATWLKKQDISLSQRQIKGLTTALYQEVETKFFQQVHPPQKTIHDFSASQEQRFREIFGKVKSSTPQKVRNICKNLRQIKQQISQTQQDILKAPKEEVLQAMVDHIESLKKDAHAYGQMMKDGEAMVLSLEVKLKEKVREQERLLDNVQNEKAQQQKLTLIAKAQHVLKRYQTQLKQKKVEHLEEVLAECWQKLTQKSGFVEQVRIDPETFEVFLYNQENHALSKDQLSSGEKQIYAIAMLWALARISGRPLPIIIDTPLGRLDSEHRAHLIERYFPFASHQVLIFSTDTELDWKSYQMLQPSISHAFHLEFNPTLQATQMKPGYFWEK